MKKTTIKSFARTGKLANRIFAATLGLTVFASAFTFQSCKDGDDDPEDPKITSISPASALPGAQITITGQHFSKEAKNNTVNIGGESATVNSSTETTIITTVPATVTKVGPVDVYVTVEGRKSNVYNTFEIAEPEPDKPVLKTVDPTEAMPGDTIALTGEYLGAQDGATLTIGGETATIIEYSETAIKAQVPELEPGEAEIELSLKGFGPVKLPIKFMVKAKPISVEGFMPDSAGYGDVVTISGKNFGTEKGDITVMVNGKEQEVTEVTDGQVKIKLEAKTWSGDVVVKKGEQKVTADKKLAYKETYRIEEKPLVEGGFRSVVYDKKKKLYYATSSGGYGVLIVDPALSYKIVDTVLIGASTNVLLRQNGMLWATTRTKDFIFQYNTSTKEVDSLYYGNHYHSYMTENKNGEVYLSDYVNGKVYKLNDADTSSTEFVEIPWAADMIFDKNGNLLVKNNIEKKTYIVTPEKKKSLWVEYENEIATGQFGEGNFILNHPAGEYTIYYSANEIVKKIDKTTYTKINSTYKLELVYLTRMTLTPEDDLIVTTEKNGLYKIIIE